MLKARDRPVPCLRSRVAGITGSVFVGLLLHADDPDDALQVVDRCKLYRYLALVTPDVDLHAGVEPVRQPVCEVVERRSVDLGPPRRSRLLRRALRYGKRNKFLRRPY